MGFPHKLPRADSLAPFIDDPLAAFRRGRARHGDAFLLAEGRALFSGAADCAGCVAVFGEANLRRVFTDLETFGMPVALADQHALPPTLARLNSGLFSMSGARHRRHQRLLAAQLDARAVDSAHEAIVAGCRAFIEPWRAGSVVPVLEEMRRLTLNVSSRVIFGDGAQALELGALVQRYFADRRDLTTSPKPSAGARRRLIALGEQLDGELRARVGALRAAGASDSVLAGLCRAARGGEAALDEQQLVTHANVLFMSGSEPMAVAMSWILLLSSQLPAWREALREEVRRVCGEALPGPAELKELKLVDWTVKETLRLLPPNAIMVRLTRRPCQLDGLRLPARCELLLSPFVAHREAALFPHPDQFDPARWDGLAPGPFEYLPFGNGHRYCLGRTLATRTLATALSAIVARFDWVLAGDQQIDWTINVNLMPAGSPRLRLGDPPLAGGGRLDGPAARLLRLPAGGPD